MPLEPQQFPATTVPTRFIGGRIVTEDPAQPEADTLVTDATGASLGSAGRTNCPPPSRVMPIKRST